MGNLNNNFKTLSGLLVKCDNGEKCASGLQRFK
jgi:hypothetical protein